MAQEQTPQNHLPARRTILALSTTSLFSDISHEMGTAILPLFLVTISGGAAALGLIEGVANFLMSVGKITGGVVGDRLRQRKWLTGGGYLTTTLGVTSYALAAIWWQVLIGRAVAWFGRGFRGPLRDSLMAEAAAKGHYGRAYGLERAGDAAGAMIGPLISAGLLALALSMRAILALAFIPGLVAAGLVWVLVRERPQAEPTNHQKLFARMHELPGSFKRFLLAIGTYSAGDFSKTLLILWAAGATLHGGLSTHNLIPIFLYAGYNAVSAVFSYVSGTLSDSMGARGLLLAGYSIGVLAAFGVATGWHTTALLVVVFALSGICVGNQEALEKAVSAEYLGAGERALGFGTLSLVNGVGKLIASALVGVLWSAYGVTVAFGAAGIISLIGVILLAVLTKPERREVSREN